MLGRDIVAILLIVFIIVAYLMERRGHKLEVGIVLLVVSLALLLDDYFAGPIPGDWGLTGAGGLGFGIRMLLDWRSASRLRA